MNPFNNRWALLGIVAVFLIAVAELVGTDENAGVLSQAAGSYAGSGTDETPPPGAVEVIDASQAADAPETDPEDEPQVIMPDSPEVEDDENVPADGFEGSDSDAANADIVDQPSDDDESSDE
jgi:hypothetical protein